MKDWKPSPEAVQLLFQGQLAYAEVMATGVRVDKTYLDKTIESMKVKIADLERELREDKVAKEWKRAYGDKMNFESGDQLADVVFNKLGFDTDQLTSTGKRSVKKSVLELMDHPFVKKYLRIKPLRNSLRTNLIGLRREIVERDGMWFVHPEHKLNNAQTYRPVSASPNWRNYPKRNKEIAELVRPCFIPRPGRHFCEVDYGQIEVRLPAALTGDKNLRKYVLDKSTDMHRDQSAEVFCLKKEEVTKAVRSQVKNNFVFASFYGAAPVNCAKRLWEDIDVYKLATASGVPMKKHLRKHGITTLGNVTDTKAEPKPGTFVCHVRECQCELWKRFTGYADWRRRTTERYQREGGLRTVTGFVVTGPHSPTEIPNYPIQGPAYHCTLQSLIRLLDCRRKYKFRTLVLGDIYDSIQSDVKENERDDWLNLSMEVMTKEIPKLYTWLGDIPLEVECEVSPLKGSWLTCEEWVKEGESWAPKAG